MKTKQIIEDLRCCNGGSCAECTMGMKPGCTDELMIAAEKEMEKCGVAINNQKHEIDALKKHVAELKKELSEREAAAAVLGDYMDIKISLLGSPQKTERWGKDGVL